MNFYCQPGWLALIWLCLSVMNRLPLRKKPKIDPESGNKVAKTEEPIQLQVVSKELLDNGSRLVLTDGTSQKIYHLDVSS